MYHYDLYKVEKVCSVPGCSVKYYRRSYMSHHERIVHGIIKFDDDGPEHNEEYFMRMYMDVKSGREDDYPNCTGPYAMDTEDVPGVEENMGDHESIKKAIDKDPFRQHRTEPKIPKGAILNEDEIDTVKVRRRVLGFLLVIL
jgi:hypothetical protein